jgi:hypothetical protein
VGASTAQTRRTTESFATDSPVTCGRLGDEPPACISAGAASFPHPARPRRACPEAGGRGKVASHPRPGNARRSSFVPSSGLCGLKSGLKSGSRLIRSGPGTALNSANGGRDDVAAPIPSRLFRQRALRWGEVDSLAFAKRASRHTCDRVVDPLWRRRQR